MSVDVDAGLVEAFRRGDDDAVRELYHGYSRLVFSVAHRVLSDRSLAEEAMQQTFLQAWRSASSFEVGRDPAPWFATIARRVAIDIQRREARRPTTALDDAPVDDPGLVTEPPSAEQLWETWQVRAAIDTLEERERDVVRMQHLDGYTHQEIAERLGVALGTVKSRSYRAHRTLAGRLRHLIEPDGDR
jgi:RNA polymerase sigma-70 factor (ECF subfamily)